MAFGFAPFIYQHQYKSIYGKQFMILGNNKKFKGVGYVCFIDVLGFSNEIMNNWNDPMNDPLEKILSIKRGMPISWDLEDDGIETRREYITRISMVSDSVTICFGLNDPLMVCDLVLGLDAVVGNIAYIWNYFITRGYTIRGAIDFGDIFWNETELIGPAFINAYRLESEVAKNSRVIVSSNLNEVFNNLYNKAETPLMDVLLTRFRKDVDGYLIVNPCILYKNETQRKSLVESLKKMRDASPSGIIREKYTPLISMLIDGSDKLLELKKDEVGHY